MRGFPVLLAALALGAPSAAHADWLLTRDGARVETDGPWEVKGRLVVFTRAGGGLASLRLTDVDLDASLSATEAATESARQAREAAAVAAASSTATERRPPVLVLTDADVGPAAEVDDESAAGAAGEATGFAVGEWDRLADEVSGEATVVGELQNLGREERPAPTLVVSVYGADGVELASTDAVIEADTIPARESARFRAVFPGLASFAAAKFRITAAPAEPSAEPPEAAGEEPAAATPAPHPDTPAPPSSPAP